MCKMKNNTHIPNFYKIMIKMRNSYVFVKNLNNNTIQNARFIIL